MKVIAFIPARCGSKSIRLKNIKEFCGKPLIFWSLSSLQESHSVDEIFVATDCETIKNVVEEFNFSKVRIYIRSPENATDTASTESVILEFIDNNKSIFQIDDIFLLVQATNPFILSSQIEEAISLFKSSGSDSLLTCARLKRFIWNEDGIPLNYDYMNRPRRQDFKGVLVENGAFYISRVENILKYKSRISGRIIIYEMPEYSYVELDEEHDWYIAEFLMYKYILSSKNNKTIKLFLSDVDGTLTDGGMYYSEDGKEIKKFNTRDGKGFELLKSMGIKTGILTSEVSHIVVRRAKKLRVDYVYQGLKSEEDKLRAVIEICKKENIDLQEVAYIGDDINCRKVLQSVGLAACPNDAVQEIKSIPNIKIMSKRGGEGAVREFVELILKQYKR